MQVDVFLGTPLSALETLGPQLYVRPEGDRPPLVRLTKGPFPKSYRP